MAGCPVLVLDEPATGLDLKNQVRVLLTPSGSRTGDALELLSGKELTALYGVGVSTMAYADGPNIRRTVAVHYGGW